MIPEVLGFEFAGYLYRFLKLLLLKTINWLMITN